jgi:8-oxo-dGTP diphosphatase
VAVGVLRDEHGRILLARRPPGAHQGGLWEFPGGKLHDGESVREALQRELHEEIGVRVGAAEPLIRVRHDYLDRCVLLDVWEITGYEGKVHGREGQPLEWAAPEHLRHYPLPPADRPIINALLMPNVYRVLAFQASPSAQGAGLSEMIGPTTGTLCLRLAEHSAVRRLALWKLAGSLATSQGVRLVVDLDIDLARQLGAAGVQLGTRHLRELRQRPVGEDFLLGALCQEPRDLLHAAELGMDYVLWGAPGGMRGSAWERLVPWLDGLALPVYVPGVGQSLEEVRAHGARGVFAEVAVEGC